MAFKRTITDEELRILQSNGLPTVNACQAFISRVSRHKDELSDRDKKLKKLAYKIAKNPKNRDALRFASSKPAVSITAGKERRRESRDKSKKVKGGYGYLI